MSHKNRGFTLVELSIILVIIALIVGGIVVGQSMIRSAKMQSVVSDVEAYKKAAITFRDKYRSLPGDFSTATSLWGTASGTPPTITATDTPTTTTMNGNGDGFIGDAATSTPIDMVSSTNLYQEQLRVWQHLANAELIPGRYTGADSSGTYKFKIGTNLPTSKIDGATYTMFYAAVTSAPSFFSGNYRHIMVFGKPSASNNNTYTSTYDPAISGIEAMQLDEKIDDGKPNTGTVRSFSSSIANGPTNCVNGTPVYVTTSGDAQTCSLIFITGF